MNILSRLVVWSCILAAIGVGQPAGAQFEELAAKVPSHANALALINVQKVMSSPPAVKENWKDKHQKSFSAGLTFLPPDTQAAVLAAQYDLEAMIPLWQAAAMTLDHQASLPLVERLTGGASDQIGPYHAVALPGDAYVVQFAPRILAAMAPANRQMVGRWVREVEEASGPRLSPYLTEAYQYANDLGTPIILAVDLVDAASPEAIRRALSQSGKYPDAAKLEQRVKLLTSLRGVTLGITLLAEQPFGKVKVDFGQEVNIPAEEAKAMLLYALAERGAMLDELEGWKPEVAGKQVTLEGSLTASGMRRLSSLFDRPPAFDKDAAVTGEQPSPGQEQVSVQASQEYFSRVTELLDDLRHKPRQQSGGRTLAQNGVWYEQYARKIDRLSVLGVDPELAAYGAYASDSLRQASYAIKMIGARTSVRQANVPPQYNYYTYGMTYGYSYRSNLFGAGYTPYGVSSTVAVPDTQAYARERARASTEERAQGAASANTIMQQLETATGDIRRKMTMKYKVDF